MQSIVETLKVEPQKVDDGHIQKTQLDSEDKVKGYPEVQLI
jgi:hypothetical protein